MGGRIVVTGGSGKVGRFAIQSLVEKGFEVLNLDLQELPPALSQHVHTIKVDLSDAGQVFSAISSPFKLTQPFREPLLQPPDAVVHLAGYARNMLAPDSETWRTNVLSTFNVLEAASKLGVRKIVLASSVCVYGVTFGQGDVDFPSFPIDETLNVVPTDVYSMSKLTSENLGRGFALKYGIDVYALRIGAVIAPDEYATEFRSYVSSPADWKVHGWSYIDARDLASMIQLSITKDGLGFQIFNATNDEITHDCPSTTEFLQKICPNTPFTRDLGPKEAPMSNRKIKEYLGFKEEHNWRKYYAA
ncbi:hypothetical protein PFICI_05119 [Pestalotiopsis fici W106-1]|uniref:NAD-dependent epimerase/dehydratase domain-containing protein n=1 Tax=Pestalotiopsis fici (strain W106-1 / CGMCC3.15140) TaxID=1229662 RepID=W3XAZ8_PESFW|nr:uncharacterized protein PFICI_05119 [Pestalotiopsis fici W106-1]ETS83243.1 hypothetical protein PFICI_05119 [Pestalotiopsis fici W106-1]